MKDSMDPGWQIAEAAPDRFLDALELWELPRVGAGTARRILARCRQQGHSLATFLRLPEAVLRDDWRLAPETVARLSKDRAAHVSRCRWLGHRLAELGAEVWLPEDPAYPARLRLRLSAPPPLLAARGEVAVLDRPTIAILNSRGVDERVVVASRAAAQVAMERGFTIVTGGMKTSYRIAAVAARAAAAPRVVVLDRGLLATFGAALQRDPFGLSPGKGRIDPGRTLVLSPFRLFDHAAPGNGARRDELVATLADVVLAVHARPGGTIERVCLEALDRGQAVLSWLGENAGLMAAGAIAIDEAELAAGRLPWSRPRFGPSPG